METINTLYTAPRSGGNHNKVLKSQDEAAASKMNQAAELNKSQDEVAMYKKLCEEVNEEQAHEEANED